MKFPIFFWQILELDTNDSMSIGIASFFNARVSFEVENAFMLISDTNISATLAAATDGSSERLGLPDLSSRASGWRMSARRTASRPTTP